MTIKQAIINIEKELKCRNDKERYCDNYEGCDEKCPAYVSYRDFTDALQTVCDWVRADYDYICIEEGENI